MSKSINLNSPELREMEKKGRFHARAFLQGQSLPDVMMRTADFVQGLGNPLGCRFRLACDFMEYDLDDAFSGSADALSRCGFFPYAELSYEFDAFQNMLLQGAFKSARDSMRRMLDVCLTSVVYLLHMRSGAEARKWISSDADTPQFSKNVKCLKGNSIINTLDMRFDFTDGLKSLYWHLCDFCHTKGVEFSTGIRKGSQMAYNGIIIRGFCEDECRMTMEDFVSVVERLAVLIVVHNVGLLAPVDKDAKWGLNPPISGFFYEHQPQRLLDVMPKEYAEYFRTFAETDPTVVSLREYFDALPDISEEEIRLQADEFHKVMKEMGK